jgi:exopolysaccharide biosynthesis WecB/TagA/CpsF family protein
MSRQEWAQRVAEYCDSPGRDNALPKLIFAANGQVVATYNSDPSYRAHFSEADAVTADGQPLVWASRLTRHPLPERAATTDLVHDVCRIAVQHGLSFFMLGSTEASNATAAARLVERYPGLRIVGRRDGYFTDADEPRIAEEIRATGADILWVGLGVGRQEAYAVRNRPRLAGVGCVMTCGGLFDYFTAEVKRAPGWMQNASLEWLFRTWQSPRKYLIRYATTNPVAAFHLLTRTRSQ